MSELNIDELKGKISAAKSVLIVLPPEPDTELIEAGLALHQVLEQQNKKSILGCSTPIEAHEEFKTTVGKRNLIVSFPYQEDAVEHVSYDIEESTGRFNLTIRPKEDGEPLGTDQVSFSYTGASADLVFTIGISELEELGKLYSDEKTFLDQATIINLKKGGQPGSFSSFDLSSVRVTSLSELLVWMLRRVNLRLPADTASKLYRQLLKATNNFQSPLITPDTFEVAAYLLRNGAKITPSIPTAKLPPAPFFNPESISAQPKTTTIAVEEKSKHQNKRAIPPDWQGPKIFRAGETS
jgi:hypothetical protein